MALDQYAAPKKICEDILSELKRRNIKEQIQLRDNAIIDRLLARGSEMTDAYREIHDKLHPHPPALSEFLSLISGVAAVWSPEEIQRARDDRDALQAVNRQIAKRAAELAELMERRRRLNNESGFSSETYHHVCNVIEAAGQKNALFRSYVSPPLKLLRGQYEPRYWPPLSDFLWEISIDAEGATAEPSDPLTAAATAAARSSQADFLKALFTAMEENKAGNGGWLPNEFKLTDRTLASVVNCILGLEPEELIDDGYVKRFRQRERQLKMTQ